MALRLFQPSSVRLRTPNTTVTPRQAQHRLQDYRTGKPWGGKPELAEPEPASCLEGASKEQAADSRVCGSAVADVGYLDAVQPEFGDVGGCVATWISPRRRVPVVDTAYDDGAVRARRGVVVVSGSDP